MATITLFTKFHEGTLDGDYALDTASDTYVCLLDSTASAPSLSLTTYSELTNELPTASGYTVGGELIGNPTVDSAGVFDGDDVTWGPGATFASRYGVIYKHSATQYLIGYIDFESLQTVTNGTFTIQWNLAGILQSTSV